jgi:hypothetical protein
MADLLQQAFSEAAKLSIEKREEFARLMLEELAKKRWLEEPTPSLREMLEEARRDHAEGRTEPLDPDKL